MIKKSTSLHFCLLQFANGLLKESFARSILPIDTYLLFLIVLLTSPHYSTVVIVPFTCSLALQNTYNEFSDNDNLTLRPRLYIILCAVFAGSWILDFGHGTMFGRSVNVIIRSLLIVSFLHRQQYLFSY